jgi:polyisoprenoid-binding protein YceI
MAHLDPSSAEVLVFTFKEGLLSAVAHDLKLRVKKFGIEVEGDTVTAEFDPSSLTVVNAMKDGQDASGALPGFSVGEIEKNIAQDVLEPKRHSAIRFQSTSITDTEVKGRLSLHGHTREVVGRRKDAAGQKIAEFRLDQRDFGIKPFTAMLGTLKVKPEILVRVAFSI